MVLNELPDGRHFSYPHLPHRALQKLWNLNNGAVAATTEELGLLCLRGTDEIEELSNDVASERLRRRWSDAEPQPPGADS